MQIPHIRCSKRSAAALQLEYQAVLKAWVQALRRPPNIGKGQACAASVHLPVADVAPDPPRPDFRRSPIPTTSLSFIFRVMTQHRNPSVC